MQSDKCITETDIYTGFNSITSAILKLWKEYSARFWDVDKGVVIMNEINRCLRSTNAIVFFDHHYAFDGIPISLGLAKFLESLKGVIIPYAAHLDMGVGREGEPSLRYKLRTKTYQWFSETVKKGSPSIRFFPITRAFELENPRLKEIADRDFAGINARYLRFFVKTFTQNRAGQVCFLTPFSGIAFPGNPALHPQLYRSLKLVLSKCDQDVPFFFAGAYPSWVSNYQYYAPLLIRHSIVVRGPFALPTSNYAEAQAVVNSELDALRKTVNFTPPDYEKILTK